MTTDDKRVAGAVVDAPQAEPAAEAQGCEPGKPIMTDGQAIPAKKVPVPLKVFGILMIIWGAVEILKLLAVVLAIILAFVFNVDITQYTGGTSWPQARDSSQDSTSRWACCSSKTSAVTLRRSPVPSWCCWWPSSFSTS